MQEIAPGTLLGHYKVVRLLGRGGMGVVYEATDQKLGRHVAVKLIGEATRDGSSARERFWREARAASSLNHPGICTIHELNESGEYPFIVMELLDGDSLEKLNRGRSMPYTRLIELGMQVADALDAAHRKGILHRDIKPANIFLTASGQAKLLDFGLAKLEEVQSTPEDESSGTMTTIAPTAVDPLTGSGLSVGTVAYMSPEQARGEPLDARSDVFSLGVVLYEMATGRHPFSGGTTAVVFDKILNHAPVAPISLNAELPPEFESILNKTLEKDRELRCQSAAELRADLKRLQRRSSAASVPSMPPAASSGNLSGTSPGPPTGTASAAPGVAAATFPSGSPKPEVRSQVRVTHLFLAFGGLLFLIAAGVVAWRFWPEQRPFASVTVNQVTNVGVIERIALSGDARFLAEVKNDNGQRTLWIRNTATNTEAQILGSFANDYVGLTFSPDGNYLYFTRGTPQDTSLRSLYSMPVFGGTPKQIISDIDSAVSFSPDGNRLAYVRWTPDHKDQYSEIHIAGKDGGNNHVAYATPDLVMPPVWSPDGKRIAWLGSVGPNAKMALHWFDVASHKVDFVAPPAGLSFPNLLTDATNLAWLPDSKHLVGVYYKAHSDRSQIGTFLLPSGEFQPITTDVNAYSQVAVSADGKLLAAILTSVNSTIALYNQASRTPAASIPLRVTPTSIVWGGEDRLFFIVRNVSLGWIVPPSPGLHTFDTGEIGIGSFLAVCNDGHILFTGLPRGEAESRLFRMNADGGDVTQITTTGIARAPYCSVDSRDAFYSIREGANASLWTVPLAGGTPRELLPPGRYYSASMSPDDKLATVERMENITNKGIVTELATGRELSKFDMNMSILTNYEHFSYDGKGVVYPVLEKTGNTLLYQPIDGAAPHTLLDPVPEAVRDFAWSPSGRQLAVARLQSSSDVVLITDEGGKK